MNRHDRNSGAGGRPTPIRLADLAARQSLDIIGDPDLMLHGACALKPGQPAALTFAEPHTDRKDVAASRAGAAVLAPELVEHFQGSAIVCDRPRLMFARLATAFDTGRGSQGIATSACISPEATIAPTASIGAYAVIGPGVHIAADVTVGAGSVIEADVVIGAGSCIGTRVSLLARTRIGARVVVASGAVIGERGFGLVPGPDGLEPMPQLGGVRIDDDVEIGANTTIDRGALEDTIIEQGVKIDNQVHVAHNCVIGAHTVIAGCTGIAGSCRIGAGCMIGGGVGIGDHVTLAAGVTLTAASQVPKSIDEPGVYSSTFRAMPAGAWRRRLALFRALDRIDARSRGVRATQRIRGDKDD